VPTADAWRAFNAGALAPTGGAEPGAAEQQQQQQQQRLARLHVGAASAGASLAQLLAQRAPPQALSSAAALRSADVQVAYKEAAAQGGCTDQVGAHLPLLSLLLLPLLLL
jgi:hypothetical protein